MTTLIRKGLAIAAALTLAAMAAPALAHQTSGSQDLTGAAAITITSDRDQGPVGTDEEANETTEDTDLNDDATDVIDPTEAAREAAKEQAEVTQEHGEPAHEMGQVGPAGEAADESGPELARDNGHDNSHSKGKHSSRD